MGMCYSVTVDLCGDKEKIVKAFQKAIRDELAGGHCIIEVPQDVSDPLEACIAAMLPNAYHHGGMYWEADFDASYGWDCVLYDVFTDVLGACDPGSSVYVNPDDYSWELTVTPSGIEEEYNDGEKDDENQ